MKNGWGRRHSERLVIDRAVKFELNYAYAQGLIKIEQTGVGIDISGRGLGILTLFPLKNDEILRLYFRRDPFGNNLPVSAKVVWTQVVDDCFRVGFEFLT